MTISVVCPFYNEELILDAAIRQMLENLESLDEEWELIVVNDGSRDRSLEIASQLEKQSPKLKVLSYPANKGRGYAIRTGISSAKGEIVITTEIDSSWGDDIVHRIIAEFEKYPDTDIIIASPHLPGGGYKNVPLMRVFLSTFGNYIIRTGLTYNVTMNTGMTRGYRRDRFLLLPLDETEKEMHLEIVNKALAFNYHLREIPVILEWKDHKFIKQPGKKRKSSASINKLIQTHVLFSVLAAPFRYIYVFALLLGLISLGLFIYSVVNLFTPAVSIYLFLASLLVGIFAVIVFFTGVLAQQGRALQREMWRVRSELRSVYYQDEDLSNSSSIPDAKSDKMTGNTRLPKL